MNIDDYRLPEELFYRPVANEVAVFEAAWQQRLPVMLKGPTGCGKTRFIEHMAWRLSRPLITVAAHEDMTAADLAGRYLLLEGRTEWQDGPLTRAVLRCRTCGLTLNGAIPASATGGPRKHPALGNRVKSWRREIAVSPRAREIPALSINLGTKRPIERKSRYSRKRIVFAYFVSAADS